MTVTGRIRRLVAVLAVLVLAAGLTGASTARGQSPTGRRFDLTIQLKSRDPIGLARFARAVSTPGTDRYRQYLTVAEFARRFGATPTALAATAAAIRRDGLEVGPASANGLSLPATGTATQIDHAAATASVQGVFGDLDRGAVAGLGTPKAGRAVRAGNASSMAAATVAGPQPCAAATTQATTVFAGSSGPLAYRSGYTADQLATVYGFTGIYGAGDEGAGQTIALDMEEPYQASDIQTFQQCYGTHTSVKNVAVAGGVSGTTDDDQAALGIETAISFAPQAKVLVYQGTNQGAIFARMVSDDKAKVISTAWTSCEAAGAGHAKSYQTLFEEAAAQGQSVFASSGDTGSLCGSDSATVLPASAPDVTAVGGTTLYADGVSGAEPYAAGRTPVEAVWNNGVVSSRPTGTGGGPSALFKMPSYQSGAAAKLGVKGGGGSCGAANCREVPDVSADGDGGSGYTIYGHGSWKVLGGTEFAAALWASFAALTDALPTCYAAPIGFANPSLYRLAGGSSGGSLFNDIVNASPRTGAANNDAAGVNGGNYGVRAGYDMATGLGSMHGSALAEALCKLSKAALPTVHGARVSGVAAGHPTLSFVAKSGSGAPALRVLSLTIPSRLKLATTLTKLKRGLSAKRGHNREKVSLSRKGRTLRLTLSPTTRSVAVTIKGPAISVGPKFRQQVKRHKVKSLAGLLTVTDASAKPTVLHLTFAL